MSKIISCQGFPLTIFLLFSVANIVHGVKVKNITAAIETLRPDVKEQGDFLFEESSSVPEIAFEFSSSSVPTIDLRLLVLMSCFHILIWFCILKG